MKKIVTAAVLATAILSQNVCMAAYEATVKDGKIKITGDALTAGDVVNITAFPTGTKSGNADGLIGVAETTVGEDGKISVEFGVRADREQTKDAESITVYIKSESDTAPQSLTVNYSIKKYNELAAALKNASAEETRAIFDNPIYAETMANLGMGGWSSISSESVKQDTVKLFNSALDKNNINPTTLSESYEKAYAIAMMNANGSNAETAVTMINAEFEGTKFSQIEDAELKKWLISQAPTRKYTSIAEYEKAYVIDNALYLINKANNGTIYDTIAKYASTLEITNNEYYKKYCNLGVSEKGKASYNIVGTLSSNKAKSAADVTEAIKQAVNGSGSGQGGGSPITGGNKGGLSVAGGGAGSTSGNNSGNQTTTVSGFNDISSVPWATEAITFLSRKGIVNGVGENTFAPNDVVTREQFVKMAVIAVGLELGKATSDFADVDKNEWYYEYISAGVEAGLINGVSDNLFGLGSVVTRQDAAVILYRAAKALSIEMNAGDGKTFADAADIADYAEEAVAAMSASGIIEGNESGEFMPRESCTRAQAAVIIYRMFFSKN